MAKKRKSNRALPKRQARESTNEKKLVLTVPEAGALFGLSKASSYFAAAKGRLPTIKMGDRLFVPRAALERMLESAGKTT